MAWGPSNIGGEGGIKSDDAVLRVRAPSGSQVTISKTGQPSKIDRTGHVIEDRTDFSSYYFPIKSSAWGTWDVTASLTRSGNTQTSTDSITIGTNREYGLELNYLIPGEYTKVKAIKSTGTSSSSQYFDMGINFYGVDRDYKNYIITGKVGIINSNTVQIFGLTSAEVFYESGELKGRYFRTNIGSVAVSVSQSATYDFVLSHSEFTVGSTTVSNTSTAKNPINANSFMFARNLGSGSTQNKGSVAIYNLRIYNGSISDDRSTLVREYIPVTTGSGANLVAGMYETVGGAFYPSASGTNFVVVT